VSLQPVIIAILGSVAIGFIAHGRWRGWSLLLASCLAIYWLQPATPIRYLDFWLPTGCLLLTFMTWLFTKPGSVKLSSTDLQTGLAIIGLILAIGLMRYLGPVCCLTPSRPPAIISIITILIITLVITYIFSRYSSNRTVWIYLGIILILGLFIILKSEALARIASIALHTINSQPTELASAYDIRWLGFSYVAFRLIHTLRDRLSGRLPGLTLQEYLIYIIFFPTYSAGPIDRVQRFTQDLHQPFLLTTQVLFISGRRILVGIFRKFVLADGIALFALSNSNSSQVQSTGWLWVMLYAFALRIYFDFSGYTDIAIGLGQLLGVQLPENFDRPYLKQNLTLFWNSWHITLAQWFRAYFFNPLTRSLRSGPHKIPTSMIILFGQLSTFLLIGLWHGISWNFAIWGAWHGIGLFIDNRWSNLIKTRNSGLEDHPNLQRIISSGSVILTFNYVCLGWVWFALASPLQSWQTMLKLFGIT
jgi:alginate O-acetyltransferase complex protein AlgI